MRSFVCAIRDKAGIHARPAGMIVKVAKCYEADIVIRHEGEKADAKRLTELMSIGAKCGDTLLVETEGTDEEKACEAMKTVLNKYL